MTYTPTHTALIQHTDPECEESCVCNPHEIRKHLSTENCKFYEPCGVEHDYQGYNPSPWEEDDVPWEGYEEWDFHGTNHEWIEGEWLVEATGRCAFVEGFCNYDDTPNEGLYSVRPEWDGEFWEAVIVEKIKGDQA